MKRTFLFVYRMSSDTGFAPCVENGLLTLACCKGGQIRNGKACNTGLRYWIGSKSNGIDYEVDDVYVLGTFHDKLLYLAKIKKAEKMEQYFSDNSLKRSDQIYSLKNGRLVRNNRLRKENIHTSKEENIRDWAGVYVLESSDFLYLGADAISIDIVTDNNARSRETKQYSGQLAEQIINECLLYRDDLVHKPHDPLNKSHRCSR